MNPMNLPELGNLSQGLSRTLQSYVPDAKVLLQWSELPDISIPLPQAEVKLMEDDYESRVERTGHGLQRALIITMLQHLDAVRSVEPVPEDGASEGTESDAGANKSQLPNLVLAIEEPELYQHPSRQRHLASVLLNLAEGAIPGVAENTQVIYATHSPLFVGLDRFAQIRVLRKVPREDGKPRTTHLKKTDKGAVARELEQAGDRKGKIFTADTLEPRLRSMMTPWMGEGFFADVVVLVEGEDDRAAILSFAKSKKRDFDGMGIAVIPCFGKSSIDRPLVIFRQLGISVYVVWDGDRDGNNAELKVNKRLLRLLGKPEQDWPHFVADSSACFKVNLEETLEDEIGRESFNQWLSEAQQEFGIDKKKDALKNPAVLLCVIDKATQSGRTSGTLESIVEKIVSLKSQSQMRL